MGESSCLFMHSPSPQDHGIALDSSQRSRHQLAFEGSVTFGRFASESLSWEKWSAFSHNRVMEEVAKYSTPGSVAQKKAYFEAHYKRAAAARKAAALLEQEKTAALSSNCDVDPMENVGAERLVGVGTVAAAVELSPVEVGDAAVDLQNEVSVSNVEEQNAYFEAHFKRAPAASEAAALPESTRDVDPMESVGAETLVGVGTVAAAVEVSPVEVKDAALDLHNEEYVVKVVEEQGMDVDKVVEDVGKLDMDVDKVVGDVVEEQFMDVHTEFEDSVHTMPEAAVEGLLRESCSTTVVFEDTFYRSDQNLNDKECSISAATGVAPLHRPDQGLLVEESSKLNNDDHIKEKRPKLSGLRSSIRHMTYKLLPSPSKLSTPTLPRKNNCGPPAVKRSTKDTLEKGKSVLRTLHMSISSSPWSVKKNTISAGKKQPSPIPEKSEVTRSSSFISGHQRAAKTTTSCSVNRSLKLTLETPPTEIIRKTAASDIVTPANRKSLNKTLQSRSTDRARTTTSSTTYSARSPTVPVAFTLRSDERAAKRKELKLTINLIMLSLLLHLCLINFKPCASSCQYQLKLEEKFNAEAQKSLLQAKTKGQTQQLNELCQSVCLKAKPKHMPDLCHQPGGYLINHTKKISPALPRIPTPKLVDKSNRAAAEELKCQPPPKNLSEISITFDIFILFCFENRTFMSL